MNNENDIEFLKILCSDHDNVNKNDIVETKCLIFWYFSLGGFYSNEYKYYS